MLYTPLLCTTKCPRFSLLDDDKNHPKDDSLIKSNFTGIAPVLPSSAIKATSSSGAHKGPAGTFSWGIGPR